MALDSSIKPNSTGKKALIIRIAAAFILFAACLTVSINLYSSNRHDRRFLFYFESFDDTYEHVEQRFVNLVPEEDEITCFLKEILLGPETERYRPLFSIKTRLLDCMLRDGVLHVNLSSEALMKTASSSETERACQLLKKNISENFSYVTEIHVYILGTEAYAVAAQAEDALSVQ